MPFYIISTIVLLLFGIVFVGGYADLWYYKDNIDFTQTVEATITDVHMHGHDGRYYYDLFYEYTSPDGTYYCGCDDEYKNRDVAVTHIGEKIQIYIDGKGKSVTSDVYHNTPNVGFLIAGIVLLLGALADFVILVIPHKWK